MDLTLERFSYADTETEGVLTVPGPDAPPSGPPARSELLLATIEPPWRGNVGDLGGATHEEASCVPDGTYELVPFRRPSGEEVWALVNPALDVYLYREDIPPEKVAEGRGRYLILIHVGNWVHDVIGCIAPGMDRACLTHQRYNGPTRAVVSSGQAMDLLREFLGPMSEGHTLTIRPALGASLEV